MNKRRRYKAKAKRRESNCRERLKAFALRQGDRFATDAAVAEAVERVMAKHRRTLELLSGQ